MPKRNKTLGLTKNPEGFLRLRKVLGTYIYFEDAVKMLTFSIREINKNIPDKQILKLVNDASKKLEEIEKTLRENVYLPIGKLKNDWKLEIGKRVF
jgi:hypothetical protein